MGTWREQQVRTVKRLVDIDLPDYSTMTLEQRLAWEPPDPDPHALLAYPLQTVEWRRAFLHDYYWVGETALFIAVAHVWSTLAPPRAARCTLMGVASGAGGTGKTALSLTLQKFLNEMLAVDHPFPSRSDYPSLDAWNADATAVFGADEAHREALIERYEAILDGRAPQLEDPGSTDDEGLVIVGPWDGPGASPRARQ